MGAAPSTRPALSVSAVGTAVLVASFAIPSVSIIVDQWKLCLTIAEGSLIFAVSMPYEIPKSCSYHGVTRELRALVATDQACGRGKLRAEVTTGRELRTEVSAEGKLW